MEEEELEQIPWSALVAEHRDERNRTIFMAAGVAVALLAGFLGARLLTGGGTVVTLPDDAAVTDGLAGASLSTGEVVDGMGAAAGEIPPIDTAGVEAGAPLSEADLMALLPDEQARAAAARAEWFVTDMFTADLDPEGSTPVRSALPAGMALPVLPHDSAVGVSYVEWARAFRVEPIDVDTYRVGVLFRSLTAPGDGLFTRTKARAVEVTVRVTPEGGTTVLDLPTPILPPPPPTAVAASVGPTPAPDAVLSAAMAAAAGWGYEPKVHSSGEASGLWRVVVSVSDEGGNRWPLVSWFDAAGNPATVATG